MKKLSTVLSVGSMALYGVSFTLLVLVTVMQSVLIPLFFQGREVAFSMPLSQFVSVGGMFVLSTVAFLLSFKEKVPVFWNILLILLPVFLVVPLAEIIGFVQARFLSAYGINATLGYTYVQNLAAYVGLLNPVAYGSYLVCGGMRLSQSLKK